MSSYVVIRPGLPWLPEHEPQAGRLVAMSYAGQIMEDYFRRTGRPGAMGLDAAYQYQVSVLRDILERLEVVLDDEGVPAETVTRVIRHMLYGSPSVADAEMRMQQDERMKDLLNRVPSRPLLTGTHPRKDGATFPLHG